MAAKKGARGAAQAATKRTAPEAGERPFKKTARIAAQRTTNRAAKNTSQEPTGKPAPRPANTPEGVIYFESPAAWRRWLAEHHEMASMLWVGYHKRDTGRPSMTWPESVDEALCYGWIDGIRKSVDSERYVIRFTPRKPTSIWSAVNIRRVGELTEASRMRPAGLRAFEARVENRSGVYSFEQRQVDLPAQYAKRLRANAAAREFFEAQPASYRKACFWWVVSAKREETRASRLERLIEHSEKGERLPQFRPARKGR